ncbi:MAG TPA: hypothetical protein VIR54_27910, partial [Vicinamibacterales bacterium]
MVSRRDLLQSALAGAAAYFGSAALAGTRLDAAQRGAAPVADLLLANGKFVDGRGVVGSAVT